MNKRIAATAIVLAMGPSGALAQTCIDVDQVTLTGVTLLPEAPLQAEFAPFLGCVGLEALNAMLETVTLAYVDAGYIAARAYLPEQDLSDGELEISVVEGRVSEIVVAENGTPAPRRAVTAFPQMEGRPLELRRLEQGIAQINRLPSSDATSELLPGAEPGDSVVAVQIAQGPRFSGNISVDDRGTPSTGVYNFGTTFAYDNLLGLNDSWTLTYSRSMEPGALSFGPNVPVGNSYSLSGTMPFGFWTYSLSLSGSDYLIDIPGVTGPIESSGQSRTVRISAERLLSLSESGRLDAGVALQWADNENQILGARIDTSSRSLTRIEAYLRASNPLWGGQLDLTTTLRHGVDWFGAFDDDTAPAGSPVAQYSAVLVDATWVRPWEVGEQIILLNSRLSGQYARQNLFGSEQFSIGGFSSVRGTRTSLLFGNSGASWTNTLSAPGVLDLGDGVTVTPYAGLDAGRVFGQSEFGIEGGSLTSYSVGATINFGTVTLDAVYSDILSAPDFAQAPDDGLFTLQARLTF
ncbi:ShlB/FhaC/HecB family hemolysin secretion/activation protein [Gymnodinialimonas hymeniacidonis]|uniref:ShlB/FhaC/HecB family hemolysin secretion/activation protein n=1 Tax=Gymnodinialimonas hymeniacidonis TaxID=3126508 RepID=UPI0034C68F83